jgi:uncharacterized membrane protein
MFALICAYLCIPERFRFIVRWLAAAIVVVVVILVVILFARIILTMPMHHGSLLHPRSHQPMSPDSISHHLHRNNLPRRVRED